MANSEITHMNLEEYVFTSEAFGYSRKIWITGSLPCTVEHRNICLFLDAEFYLNRMDVTKILEDLPEPVVGVFVSNQNAESRHVDYTCYAKYSEFIAVEVMDWVNGLLPDTNRSGNLIAGLSLSGLAAAHIALSYLDRFSRAICQSGSFWWNGEWFAENAPSLSSKKGRFWLSVGDQEIESGVVHAPTGLRQDVSQIDACEGAARSLSSAGHTVHFNRFEGGHDIAPWKAELPAALKWQLER